MAISTQMQRTAAVVLSRLGHPFVLLPLTVIVSLGPHIPRGRLLFILLVYFVSIILPLGLIIRRRVRAGQWTDTDVSDIRQRRQFYPIMLVVLAISIAVFALLGLPRPLIVGTAMGFALLASGRIINRWFKISLHMMFAAFCAVIVARNSIAAAFFVLALLAAIAWSRLVLQRHTGAEVICGVVLGAFGGGILLGSSAASRLSEASGR